MDEEQRLRESVEKELERYLMKRQIPLPLKSAMRYSLEAGGKRIRPVMLLMTCSMFGGDMEKAMPLACALEMIHTYSLIHDDLPAMDNDVLRRGKPTNHVVYGEAMAILAGDGLLNTAFEVMMEEIPSENPTGYLNAMKAIAYGAGASGMIAGQCIDIDSIGKQPTEELLLQMHSKKTGALFLAAIRAGALLSDCSQEQLAIMDAYAGYLGVLFQITDDILDVVGIQEELGKSVGKDASECKLTYTTVYGLEKSRQMAEVCAANARDCLTALPHNEYFADMIDRIIKRNQ